MADGYTEVRGRPVGGHGQWLIWLVWIFALGTGIAALTLAWMGWAKAFPPSGPESYAENAVRTLKVLVLSDIYYDKDHVGDVPDPLFAWARGLGTVFSLTVAVRLIVLALGQRFFGFLFRRSAKKHHLIIGDGPAASEYAAHHSRMFDTGRAIHLCRARQPIADRLATFERRGRLQDQLRFAAAKRARRIVIDEGDDADTWQTAQKAAELYPKAEVLAHITDPWIRDQLSHERLPTKLVPFSYAGGAARQVMLAHPPYLLAKELGEKRQHILIVGFGQVGQAVLREFIVTCVLSTGGKLMVTIVDPRGDELEQDFKLRHRELMKEVDLRFITGNFRVNAAKPIDEIRQQAGIARICAAYVAIDQEYQPLDMALVLRTIAQTEKLFDGPIFLCAQHGAGLATVSPGAGNLTSDPVLLEERYKQAMVSGVLCNRRVVPFGAWPAAFDGAGMLEPIFDEQARAYHEEYERLRVEQERATTNEVKVPITPWRELSDSLRLANRRAAAHIRAKAFEAGFELDGWLGQKKYRETHELPKAVANMRTDDPDFVLGMARLEHNRWILDRYLDGWSLGERSDFLRTRTTFVPFEKLPGKDRDKDTTVIRVTRKLMEQWNSGKKRKFKD